MAVGIGDDADAKVLLESVAHDPFECAPGGMYLDRGLELAVVRVNDVRVAAADMGDHDAIPALQLLEQPMGVVCVRGLIGHIGGIGDLRVRGAMNGLAFMAEVHVTVTADRRIGRPFVAGMQTNDPGLSNSATGG